MIRTSIFIGSLVCWSGLGEELPRPASESAVPSGNAVIRAKAGSSEIVITMGIFSPDQPSRGFEKVGYGRFRFKAERVVKWNCVFRLRSGNGITPGDYRYRMFVALGKLEDVKASLAALVHEFAG